MRTKLLIIAAAALGAGGCSNEEGFVLSVAGPGLTTVERLDVAFTLGGRSTSSTLREPSGTIHFPTDAFFRVAGSPRGALDVVVTAVDSKGATVATGQGGGVLAGGTGLRVAVDLAGEAADLSAPADLAGAAGDLALSPDLAPPADLSGIVFDLSGSAPVDLAATFDMVAPRDLAAPPDLASPVVTLTVAVEQVSGIAGTITSSDGKISCPGTCGPVSYASGATVTLQTSSGSGKLLGWADQCKGTSTSCTLTLNASQKATASFGPTPANYVFVTSSTMTPPFGATAAAALSNADAFCNTKAAAAGLPGHYHAFLASGTASAFSRLTGNGWVRPDGRPVANTAASLNPSGGTGNLFYPPNLDELGEDLRTDTTFFIASGQFPLQPSTDRCNDWTSNSSTVNGWSGGEGWGGFLWYSYQNVPCSTATRLMCFGIDNSTTVTPPAFNGATGRAMWLSTTTYSPTAGGSIDNADAICRNEAMGAGLPDGATSYQAFITPKSGNAFSRFDLSAGGKPWVRRDGVVIASSAGITQFPWNAPISQDINGNLLSTPSVWSGSFDPNNAGQITETCNGWSAATASDHGDQGDSRSVTARSFAGSFGSQVCTTKLQLYCAHK